MASVVLIISEMIQLIKMLLLGGQPRIINTGPLEHKVGRCLRLSCSLTVCHIEKKGEYFCYKEFWKK